MEQAEATRKGRSRLVDLTNRMQEKEKPERLAPPYTIPGFAEAVGVRPSTVRKMLMKRQIAFFRIGRRVSIPASEATRMISENLVPALSPEPR
jgi:excisionase family DNA binding protein